MDKEARKEDARFMLKVLIIFVLGFALLHLAPAHAVSFTAQDSQGNRLSITDKPCTQSGWLQGWQHADLSYQGKQFAACWKAMGDYVLVVDSSGDVFPFPVSMFRKDEGA